MSTLFVVGVVFVALVAALMVANKSLGLGLWHLLRTKLGLAGDRVKQIDPAAQMKQAALDGLVELKAADEALIQCRAMRAQLQRQEEADAAMANRLRTTVNGMLGKVEDGDPNLVDKVRRIKELEASATKCREQLKANETIYQATLKRANDSAKKMKSAIEDADRMKINLKLGEQMNKLQAMLNQYDPSAVNGSITKIDEYRQVAQNQMDRNDAVAQVMADRAAAMGVGDEAADDTSDVADMIAQMKAKKASEETKE